VPNILVQGKSIGGGDDMVELSTSGQLKKKIEDMTKGRVSVARRQDGESGEMKLQRRKRDV
jgi:hypothetical protein